MIGAEPRLSTIDKLDDLVIIEADFDLPGIDARLEVFELVRRVRRGNAHREKYSYKLWLDGRPVVRFERDPQRHPEMPDHKHLHDNTRVPMEISLREMLFSVWDELKAEQDRRLLLRKTA
jgi:hypothetical protein